MRTSRSAPTILALVAGLAVTLLGCSRGTPTTAPTIATTSGPTVAAASPSTAAGTSMQPSAPVAPIADGTYQSGTNLVSDVLARIKADNTLTASQKAHYEQGFTGHHSDVVRLDLHAGVFIESDALDGAPMSVGAKAAYAFPDSHTLVIQEDCCGLSTFTVTPQPNGFSLAYKAGAPNAGEDVVGRWLYGASPFTLVP